MLVSTMARMDGLSFLVIVFWRPVLLTLKRVLRRSVHQNSRLLLMGLDVSCACLGSSVLPPRKARRHVAFIFLRHPAGSKQGTYLQRRKGKNQRDAQL